MERARNKSKPNTAKTSGFEVVFVGGLDFYMTREKLERIFNKCGPIKEIRMPMSFDNARVSIYALSYL